MAQIKYLSSALFHTIPSPLFGGEGKPPKAADEGVNVLFSPHPNPLHRGEGEFAELKLFIQNKLR